MRRLSSFLACAALLADPAASFAQCVCDFTMDELGASNNSIVLCELNPASCLCEAGGVPAVNSAGLIVAALLLVVFGAVLARRSLRGLAALAALLLGSALVSPSMRVIAHDPPPAAEHTHAAQDLDQDQKECINQEFVAKYGLTKVGPPTLTFNCFSFVLDNSTSWIKTGAFAVTLLDVTHNKVPTNAPAQVGDVIVYRNQAQTVTHMGKVSGVNGNGMVTEVTSKWGSAGTYKHAPDNVLPSYGTKKQLWRPG